MYHGTDGFLETADSMKYKHIVFDIDGTLIDTEYAILHSLQKTVAALSGNVVPYAGLEFALGITGIDALKRLGIKNIPHALSIWEKYMRRYMRTVKVFDGVTGLLGDLMETGCETGIVTSKTREEFEHDFSGSGISRYFETVVCADDTQEHKPDGAPLLKYLELTGADRRETLYIGDSGYDSLCAGNAGVDFALAVWGSRRRAVRADYFLEKPDDLLAVISCLPGGFCNAYSNPYS